MRDKASMPARATSFPSKVTNAIVRAPSSNPHGILVILPNCTCETSVYEFREHTLRPQQFSVVISLEPATFPSPNRGSSESLEKDHTILSPNLLQSPE